MELNNNQRLFLSLVKAGLWEKEVRLLPYGEIDFNEVFKIAEEQSVVGLVAAGLEHIVDVEVPREILLTFVGRALQLEQQNVAMNHFIEMLAKKLNDADIEFLLVKGQGIAQCYERPLWRTCGDVDLLLDAENYNKAKLLLTPLASAIEDEIHNRQHLGITIVRWTVELHGTLRTGLGKQIDSIIEESQKDAFQKYRTCLWKNGNIEVPLPDTNNDVVFVFTHILQHFFKSGIGLRQLCDWCRLIWMYKDEIDKELLEKSLSAMRLMTEWRVFASLSVDLLGMPKDAMLLYSSAKHWHRKAERVLSFIIETGNFGHNRDMNYIKKKPFMIRKSISFWRSAKDCLRRFIVFPKDSIRVWVLLTKNSLIMTLKGE